MFERLRDYWNRKEIARHEIAAAREYWMSAGGERFHVSPASIKNPDERRIREVQQVEQKKKLEERMGWLQDNFLKPMINAGEGRLAMSRKEDSGIIHFGTYGGIRDLDLRPGPVGARIEIKLNQFNARMDTVMQDKTPALSPVPLSPEYAYNAPKKFLISERGEYADIASEFKKFLRRHFDDAAVAKIMEPVKPAEIKPVMYRWVISIPANPEQP